MKDHRNKTAGSGWMVRLVRLLVCSLSGRDFDYCKDHRYGQPYPNTYEKLTASLLVPVLGGVIGGIIAALTLF